MNGVPFFRGGVVNPARDLNTLAQQVLQQQLHVAPPLVLEQGPMGPLIRLDAQAATEVHNAKSRIITEAFSIAPGLSKTFDLFTPPRAGVYLFSGRLFLRCDTRTRPYQNVQVTYAVNDQFTPSGLTTLCFPPNTGASISVNPCFLLYINATQLAAVPSGREYLQVTIINAGDPLVETSNVTDGGTTNYFEAVRLFDGVTA